MDKKENFKIFISNHPEVLDYIKRHEMSFQDFYEIYDIYGDNNDVWNKYFKETSFSKISNIVKKIDMNNIQNHVNNAQKVVGILEELTKKSPEKIVTAAKPIESFFGE